MSEVFSKPLHQSSVKITDSYKQEVEFDLLLHKDDEGPYVEFFIQASYLNDSIYAEDMPRNEIIRLRDFLSEFLERTQ